MCIKIRYKNGVEMKFDNVDQVEEQLQNIESVKIEGKTTKKEKKALLSLMAKGIEENHKKWDLQFEEIQLSLRSAKR